VRGLLSLSGSLDPPEVDYTETARLREPHAKQRKFIDSEAKRIVIRAGRPADRHAQDRHPSLELAEVLRGELLNARTPQPAIVFV
jgi:hypothetical protein